MTCQQTKHSTGNPGYPVQSIKSSKFIDLVRFRHDECDVQRISKITSNNRFASPGTPARMQSDNLTNFTAETAQELMIASQITKGTSTPDHTRGDETGQVD